jgi:membrane-associated phospholipid phosphatase
MAARDGLLPPVERLTSVVLGQLAGSSGSGVSSPDTSNGLVNNVAAIPSMHAAWCFYACLFLWQRTRRWRWVLVAYPVAMAFSLIYGGEHYVFDILLGWAYATAAFVAMNWIVNLRTKKSEATNNSPGPVEEHGPRSVLVR